MPQPSITKTHLKITYLRFHSNLPGANELIQYWKQKFSLCNLFIFHQSKWHFVNTLTILLDCVLLQWAYSLSLLLDHFIGLMQERHNTIANALELHLSCTNPWMWGESEVRRGDFKYVTSSLIGWDCCRVKYVTSSLIGWDCCPGALTRWKWTHVSIRHAIDYGIWMNTCTYRLWIKFSYSSYSYFIGVKIIRVRSRNCGCLVTWFCYQLIAKPGNKTATVSWRDPSTWYPSFVITQ